MKQIVWFTAVLTVVPVAVSAQGARTGSAPPSSSVQTSASATAQLRTPPGWSAEGKARLQAMFNDAQEHQVPTQPMERRVAEGAAKGASEATILASVGRLKANLEASHEAMVAAGRQNPAAEETARGASAMERGVTKVQIEQMVRSTPSDRSLVVAFDVLTQLAARGVPVVQAVAQVRAKLDARATDQAISALVPRPQTSAGVNAQGTATAGGTAAAARPSGAGVGVTGAATGVVTGVVKRP